jgi:predicted esterase
MLSLGRELSLADISVAFVAPQAAGGTWYPQRFLAPLEQNEPHLTSALGVVAELLEELLARGIPRERVVLVGFSQGACLALEFAARHPHRYGGVAGLSGALIGPPDTKRDILGSLHGTPVFLGCSDMDSHVPLEAVNQSTEFLRKMHADVVERIYPGMSHTVNAEELRIVSNLVRQAAMSAEER